MALFTPFVVNSKHLPSKKNAAAELHFSLLPITYDKQDFKNDHFSCVIANQKLTQQTIIETKIQREKFS